jgi:hypothetical protein
MRKEITMRNLNKLTNWKVLVLLSVIVFAVASNARASVRVGGWSMLVDGHVAQGFQYTGACPADLEFHWGVIGTDPGPVTYSISRNDGGHSSPMSIVLPSANRSIPIVDHWHLGANNATFANYSGWIQLDIQSPNPVSQRIPFTLHCAGPTVRVGGWSMIVNGQVAQGFQYSGACPADLEFHWGVIGTAATPVSYTFTRNDGGHSSSPMSINLPSANRSIPIVDHWKLGANNPQFANYSGWVQLDIQSPNAVSQKIAFTLHCQ